MLGDRLVDGRERSTDGDLFRPRTGRSGTRLTAARPAPRLHDTAPDRTIGETPRALHCPRRRPMFRFRTFLAPATSVHAHCDLPCGVYDPEQARIEAESVYKIIEKYAANEDPANRPGAFHIKEEAPDLANHHLNGLWNDYFNPDHLAPLPNLHDLSWNATN